MNESVLNANCLQVPNFLPCPSVGGPRDAECTNALLFMIAKDYMPLRTTERQGFRVFVSTLQPLYKIPSEPVVTRLLNDKYNLLRRKVGIWLEEAKHITLTMDLWTHRESMKGYLGVTAHFRRGKDLFLIIFFNFNSNKILWFLLFLLFTCYLCSICLSFRYFCLQERSRFLLRWVPV